MNSLKKFKRLLSRIFVVNYFKYNKLISSPTSAASTSIGHHQNEMHKAFRLALAKSILVDALMAVCNFCEIFLLILILLYAFYHSIWLVVFIAAGFLGNF